MFGSPGLVAEWLPTGVAAHPVSGAHKSKRGLALSIPYNFKQARFSVGIDTLTLDLALIGCPIKLRLLVAELQEQLGVSVRSSSDFSTEKKTHPLSNSGLTIQDVSPSVLRKLRGILERWFPDGDLPPVYELHVALDAHLSKPGTDEEDHIERHKLLDCLSRHLLVDPEITQGHGGMRWFFRNTVFARLSWKTCSLPHDRRVHFRRIDPKATMYLGARESDLNYMVIHKISDHRWKAGAAPLPSRKRCVRIEARIKGVVLAKAGLTTIASLQDRDKLRTLSRHFRFRCPVVRNPEMMKSGGRISTIFVAREAADFHAAGVWAVVDREIWKRGVTLGGLKVGSAAMSKRPTDSDGARHYSLATKAYSIVAHKELGRIVDRAFRKFAHSMSKGKV